MAAFIFRQKKWRFWFKNLDVDCGRAISLEDWVNMADEFIRALELRGSAAIKARSAMLDWATLVFGLGVDGMDQITEEQFVRILENFRQQNPKFAQEVVEEIYGKLLYISDQEKDGLVTEDEFVILNRAFGFEEAASRELFQFIGPPEDSRGIDIETLSDFWSEFVLGEDKIIFSRMSHVIDSASCVDG